MAVLAQANQQPADLARTGEPARSSLHRLDSTHDLRAREVLQAPRGDVAEQFAEAQTVVAEPVGVPPLIGRVGRLFDQALFT